MLLRLVIVLSFNVAKMLNYFKINKQMRAFVRICLKKYRTARSVALFVIGDVDELDREFQVGVTGNAVGAAGSVAVDTTKVPFLITTILEQLWNISSILWVIRTIVMPSLAMDWSFR